MYEIFEDSGTNATWIDANKIQEQWILHADVYLVYHPISIVKSIFHRKRKQENILCREAYKNQNVIISYSLSIVVV